MTASLGNDAVLFRLYICQNADVEYVFYCNWALFVNSLAYCLYIPDPYYNPARGRVTALTTLPSVPAFLPPTITEIRPGRWKEGKYTKCKTSQSLQLARESTWLYSLPP